MTHGSSPTMKLNLFAKNSSITCSRPSLLSRARTEFVPTQGILLQRLRAIPVDKNSDAGAERRSSPYVSKLNSVASPSTHCSQDCERRGAGRLPLVLHRHVGRHRTSSAGRSARFLGEACAVRVAVLLGRRHHRRRRHFLGLLLRRHGRRGRDRRDHDSKHNLLHCPDPLLRPASRWLCTPTGYHGRASGTNPDSRNPQAFVLPVDSAPHPRATATDADVPAKSLRNRRLMQASDADFGLTTPHAGARG